MWRTSVRVRRSCFPAQDSSDYSAVIDVAKRCDDYDALVKYLVMTRKKVKEARVDTELCYAYARVNSLGRAWQMMSSYHVVLDPRFLS